MSEVVPVDFGKEQRESARRFARLLGIVADQDAAILRDARPFLDRAGGEIARLQHVVREAAEALLPNLAFYMAERDFDRSPAYDAITVDRADYERLKRCAAIVERERNRPLTTSNDASASEPTPPHQPR